MLIHCFNLALFPAFVISPSVRRSQAAPEVLSSGQGLLVVAIRLTRRSFLDNLTRHRHQLRFIDRMTKVRNAVPILQLAPRENHSMDGAFQ